MQEDQISLIFSQVVSDLRHHPNLGRSSFQKRVAVIVRRVLRREASATQPVDKTVLELAGPSAKNYALRTPSERSRIVERTTNRLCEVLHRAARASGTPHTLEAFYDTTLTENYHTIQVA